MSVEITLTKAVELADELRQRGFYMQLGNERDGTWKCGFWNLGRCIVIGSHADKDLAKAIGGAYVKAHAQLESTP